MAHTAEFINANEFDALFNSGDFERLYKESKDVMKQSTLNYDNIFKIEGVSEVSIDDVDDEKIIQYWHNKFRSYADENTIHSADNIPRKLMARKVDGRLVELRTVMVDGQNLIECNFLVGTDANGSKSWIYTNESGKAMYDLYRSVGCNKITIIIDKGSKIAFLAQKAATYGDINDYVDFNSIAFEDIVNIYPNVQTGEDVHVEQIKFSINIKDY